MKIEKIAIKEIKPNENNAKLHPQWQLDQIKESIVQFGFDLSDEYENFIDKFQEKKTTDDCYTPQNIYDAVKEYIVKKYNLGGREVIRPFYPGGDYQNYKYPENCIVIDNPPFSIITSICDWYNENGIDFFLFAPYLTNLNSRANHIITEVDVTYQNGANVATSFLTNLGNALIETEPELQKIIEKENEKNAEKEKRKLEKYKYPKEVLTATRLGYLAKHGVKLELRKDECTHIKALDAQTDQGKAIFGSGFLTSKEGAERYTQAEAQAEAQARSVIEWKLSEREQEIVDNLGVK